jgi:hypothetical protein
MRRDAETQEPIEGVVVLGFWERYRSGNPQIPLEVGPIAYWASEEVATDADGPFIRLNATSPCKRIRATSACSSAAISSMDFACARRMVVPERSLPRGSVAT